MMTLHRLRGYYVALVLADHVVWFGLLPFTAFVWQVNAALEFFRILLFGLALLPARFRLAQIRAVRWVSGYYFVLGAAGAWLGQACADGAMHDMAAQLLPHILIIEDVPCTALGQNAWLLGLYAVLVLVVNARLTPRVNIL